jgi:Na+/H+ antiporter NhaB
MHSISEPRHDSKSQMKVSDWLRYVIIIIIIIIIIIMMALQPFVGPWTLYKFLELIHSLWDSLDGGSVRTKAFTYTQN